MDANNNPDLGNDQSHRDTPHQQIQQLEEFFRQCSHPDENQMMILAGESGLGLSEIIDWFQDKRRQTNVLHDRVDYNSLRTENNRIHDGIQAFSEPQVLSNEVISTTEIPFFQFLPPSPDSFEKLPNSTGGFLGQQSESSENNRMQIQALSEHQMLPNEITSMTGRPFYQFLPSSHVSFEQLPDSTTGVLLGQQRESSSLRPDIALTNSQKNLIAASELVVSSENNKEGINTYVALALDELAELFQVNEPFWVNSPTDGRYVLDREYYSQRFPKSSPISSISSRIESSKNSALVPIKASDLAGIFLDMNQWADLFPTIVNKAKILKSLDTGRLGGSLHLIYGRMHILSPLVVPREFIFLRYCVQRSMDTWFIVDVSCDNLIENQAACPTRSRMFPSGVMIRSLSAAESEVTWVEHVQVTRSLDHPLYENLLSRGFGYGASRWLKTLTRMRERSLHSIISRVTCYHGLEGVLSSLKGRENLTTLSLRMIREFCAILSMPTQPVLSESFNPDVKMSVRNNNEPGQPRGMIVSASTSIRLPFFFEYVFNFLRNDKTRSQWDEMHNRSPVDEILHMSTGNHPGSSISIIQPRKFKEKNMYLLQESSFDLAGALVIFAPVELVRIMEIASMDTHNIPLLPCGFLISSDGCPNRNGRDGASTSSRGNTSRQGSSLLTLASQSTTTPNHMKIVETANNLNTIIVSTINYIKWALNCPYLG